MSIFPMNNLGKINNINFGALYRASLGE